MNNNRTDEENLTDDAVLLTLWSMALEENDKYEALGELKAMKLAFLLGYDLYQSKIKGLNFEFYRWDWGPMANEFYVSVEHYRLADLGLLDKDDHVVLVNPEGRKLAKHFEQEVLQRPENEAIYRSMRLVALKYGPMTQGEILERIYSKKVYTLERPDTLQTIASVPLRKHFTRALQSEEATEVLQVPPGWLVTLELSSSREARRSIRAAIADMKAGRESSMEEFFATL